jgi:hypothetical protein
MIKIKKEKKEIWATAAQAYFSAVKIIGIAD